MKTKNLLLGTLTGGVVMFLLGAIIFGMLLPGVMLKYTNSAISRPSDQMVFWAIILSNFIWAFLLSLILNWKGTMSLFGAAQIGAIVGGLACLAFDLTMHSMTTLYLSKIAIVADVVAFGLMTSMASVASAWVMNKVSAQKAVA